MEFYVLLPLLIASMLVLVIGLGWLDKLLKQWFDADINDDDNGEY